MLQIKNFDSQFEACFSNVSEYFPAGTNLTRVFAEQSGVLLEGGNMFVAKAAAVQRPYGHILHFLCYFKDRNHHTAVNGYSLSNDKNGVVTPCSQDRM